ncbi:MAG TPA: adenylate/guanylate cyclase domain-containing protein [Burkholderiaceae bacterium]|jgi:adenylate cyclase|nr:adenylate/guanylate cyclase domain-containing protein [Burkholderiaceae bacterium]HPH14171.1 adenylate/guanylate cyclase domain-containing protein [Burkholderiaceae bacterium]
MSVRTTVVFTDLIGSTGVFEAVGNLKATEVVTRLTGWIGEVCVAYGGRVVKTMGDGVLAIFPEGPEAIEAVVEMQRTHQKNMVHMPANLQMPIRIGVASGEVEIVAGDCFGDAVNVAARLSDLSGPHQIWANGESLVHVNLRDGIRMRSLGPITIRGRAEPCLAYQVEWKEGESTEFLTMQASLDTRVGDLPTDVLGGQIELTWVDTNKVFKSFEMPMHIGRVREVEFLVNDPRVSRMHARIDWRNGSVMLVDVSTYGVWVRFAGATSDLVLRREECVLHGRGEIALGAPFSDLSVPTVAFSVT